MRICRAWILAASVTFLASACALAQSPSGSNIKGQAAKPGQAPKVVVPHSPPPYHRDKRQFEARGLTKPPDLPYMPPWPSQYKMLDAAVSPNAKSGPAFHVQFAAPDSAEEVLTYYHRMLASLGWKISRETDQNLSAQKGGNSVNIYTSPLKMPKEKTTLLVLYSEFMPSGSGQR